MCSSIFAILLKIEVLEIQQNTSFIIINEHIDKFNSDLKDLDKSILKETDKISELEDKLDNVKISVIDNFNKSINIDEKDDSIENLNDYIKRTKLDINNFIK